jgi:hypothetical protein
MDEHNAILKYLEIDKLDQVTRGHVTLLHDVLQKECAEPIKTLKYRPRVS